MTESIASRLPPDFESVCSREPNRSTNQVRVSFTINSSTDIPNLLKAIELLGQVTRLNQ